MGFILANRDLLLETILHYVPRMERKNVMEQHAFFISTINDKISNGKKFILEYDDLKTLVSVIFLYRLVVAPLEHAEDFYNRMNRFGVSSVTLGRYSLDGAGVERNSQIIARFHGMVKEFFEKKSIQNWKGIFEIETTLDFERFFGE